MSPPSPADDPLRPPLPLPLAGLAGFLMGSADAVPGVSGGTIALIVGIYERLITSISRVLRSPTLVRSPEGRARLGDALRFLLPLGVGIGAALYLGTLLLVGPEARPGWLRRPATAPLCYALFFGLVLASLREPWGRIASKRLPHVLVALATAAAAVVFAGLPYAQGQAPTWTLLYGGAFAVAVMLLPGISGSLFLLMIGQYTTVAGAVHDRDLGLLLVFAAGIGLGAALFVPVLRHLLRRHHDLTMAALTGLMAGSLRAIWPWKLNYDPKVGPLTNQAPVEPILWVVVFLGLGVAAAWGLSRLEKTLNPAGA